MKMHTSGGIQLLVVITGGAGFIGSHLTDELVQRGHTVRVLDNLDEQVHGRFARPGYLHSASDLVIGDIRDAACLARALRGADAVVHLAAKVGVGQSMYEIERYVAVNELGTAALLQAMIKAPIGKLVVVSSMSIYGEGLMQDRQGRLVETADRDIDDLRHHPLPLPELERLPPPPRSPVSFSR